MAVETRPSPTLGARVLLTLLGAAGLIVGAFLDWLGGGANFKGTKIKYDIFYAKNPDVTDTFFLTAGFVMIVIGCLAILGLAMQTGALTRLAGALGLIAVILFGANVYRNSPLDISNFKIGIWLCLGGSVLALIAGFIPGRRTSVVAPAAPAAPPPPPA
jgi:hypothetical protein